MSIGWRRGVRWEMALRRLPPEQRAIIRVAEADRAPRYWHPRTTDLEALDDLIAGCKHA